MLLRLSSSSHTGDNKVTPWCGSLVNRVKTFSAEPGSGKRPAHAGGSVANARNEVALGFLPVNSYRVFLVSLVT